jgi:signal peptidase I
VERADLPIPIPNLPPDPIGPADVTDLNPTQTAPTLPLIVAESSEEPPAPVENTELPVAEEIPPPPEEKYKTSLVLSSASRQWVEYALIFVCAIIFLRALAVEPFGVPTGSMAPTLTGNHRCVHCPRCDYPVRVGDPTSRQSTVLFKVTDQTLAAIAQLPEKNAPDAVVSKLLAIKDRRYPQPEFQNELERLLSVEQLREFRDAISHNAGVPTVTCPNCGKSNIELDRAAEIAGDRLLVDKNVFSLRSPRRWEAAVFRNLSDKTNKPYVKRVAGLPGEAIQVRDGDVYINGHIARKNFTQVRETRVPIFDMNYPPHLVGWQHRWLAEPKATLQEAAIDSKELHFGGTNFAEQTGWATYRHCRYHDKSGEDREDVIRDSFAYNGQQFEDQAIPVHDFSIEFEVEILAGNGALACRAWDGLDQVVAAYPVGASAEDASLQREGTGRVRGVARKPLQVGKKYHIEMSFCDRRVLFAVDGTEIFQPLDLPPATTRAEVMSPFALGFQGVSAVVRDLRIYRDIYYRSQGNNAIDQPYQLGKDEYFMLGDNSSNSDDSRFWTIPGVAERSFLGKPFLLHQPSKDPGPDGNRLQHWLQSIDWGRIRWLR